MSKSVQSASVRSAWPAPKLDLGGTFRAADPAETLARVRPIFSKVGITRVADVTGLDRIGIPVAMCVRPEARTLTVSQGKGISRDLARISAIMESIETYHAEHARPPDIVASYREMRRRYATLNPASLKPGIRWRAYHLEKKLGWIRGADLASGEPVFVPHARIYMESVPAHTDVNIFSADSNGLASGNDLWEAICHGLYETIERDSDWRWYELSLAERQSRLLDNGTIDAPLLRSYLERCDAAGVVARIWEITSDLGIPAYRCIIRDGEAWRPLGAHYGAGCHISKEVAIARALTEAAQSRLTFIAGTRDDIFPSSYEQRRARWIPGPAESLMPGTLDFRARQAPPAMATFEEDARYVVRRLVKAGYRRVVVIDHTRPDLGIPVAHVIVPGLQFCKG
jgi:ribosomal protein S12 methylthiotransferase accessory factor